jgi:MoxR-like ATPase
MEPEQAPVAPHESDAHAALARRIAANIASAVQVRSETLTHLMVALLAEGHVLIEDYPGVGKTALARALARSVDSQFARVQCTSDLLPADVVGTNVYLQREQRFEFRPGPVFANVVLVDEINRASPKTQSGLLECMQERRVTVDVHTHELARPFLVLATQNPIESEGTYPLPEAQVDRFLLKIVIGYPSHDEELTIVQRQLVPHPELRQVLTLEELRDLQRSTKTVYVDPALISYAVELATATRTPARYGLVELSDYIAFGASPRGPISVVQAARALALIRGRDYVVADDIQALARDAFRHRLVLTYQALAEEMDAEKILDAVLAAVPVPQVDLTRASTPAA